MTWKDVCPVGAALLLLGGLGASPLVAQNRAVVTAGPTFYDLSGTGTGFGGALRLELPLGGPAHFEFGGALLRTETQAGRTDNLVLPEAGLGVRFPWGSVTGYVVAGAGAHVTVKGDEETKVTLFGAVGGDVPLSGPWALRVEGRLRAIDPWTGSTADLMVGVRRTLGVG